MKKWAAIMPALLLFGCSTNLYYPEDFFSEGNDEAKRARFAQHWDAILNTPVLYDSLETESGRPIPKQGTVILRASGPDCPGLKIQDRFAVWEAMQERYPEAHFEVLNVDEATGPGPAADWVLRQRRQRSRLLVGDDQRTFDRFWHIYEFNPERKDWDQVARSWKARRAATREAVEEDGWIWKMVPCMPTFVVIENGRVNDDGFICGTPHLIVGDAAPDFVSWSQDVWKRTVEERREIMRQPITEEQRETGRRVARALGSALGLESGGL